jgi:hypothetical protein
MSGDSIRGRNLVKSGRFPDKWEDHWKRRGTQGGKLWQTDPIYGHYLFLNGQAVYVQSIAAASFTEDQFPQVEYRFGFRYENLGGGLNARVVLKPTNAEEDSIELSGVEDAETLAEWRSFLDHPTRVLQGDKTIDIEIHGSDSTDGAGFRTTDFELQILLPELVVAGLKLDGREYLSSTSTLLR